MGWHWSHEPERYKPCQCACCERCWLDTKIGQCVYGGPFAGYADARTGRLLTDDGVTVENDNP